jgi:hypothetical protein
MNGEEDNVETSREKLKARLIKKAESHEDVTRETLQGKEEEEAGLIAGSLLLLVKNQKTKRKHRRKVREV